MLLLGRYKFLRPRDIGDLQRAFPGIDLAFLSVHGAKGLEADHVVVLGLQAGRTGFPSEIADDPVLAMVLPDTEA